MKRLGVLFVMGLLVIALETFAQTTVSATSVADLAGKRVMVLGDSITENGTYVSFIEYYLNKHYPENTFDIVSIGLSSETASGLSEPGHPGLRPCIQQRIGSALTKIKPQVIMACYGMNDGIYHPLSQERKKAFQDGILKLVKVARMHGVGRVVLLTPPLFDPRAFGDKVTKEGDAWQYFHPYYRYDEVLVDYSVWIMKLKMDGVSCIDLHTPMAAFLASRCKKDAGFRLAGDGIHPTTLGHLVMAHAVLKVLGCDVGEDELDAELAKVQAAPLFVLVNQRRTLRSDRWRSYVGGGMSSIDETEVAAAELQARIDVLRGQSTP